MRAARRSAVTPPQERRGRPRVRVRRDKQGWYAALIDAQEKEVSRSPHGTELEAEKYMDNYRRFGAWKAS